MTSVPDFSQAPAAAAVERTTPPGGEPLTAADAELGTAGLAADAGPEDAEPDVEPDAEPDGEPDPEPAG
jgi:hypothetical protein